MKRNFNSDSLFWIPSATRWKYQLANRTGSQMTREVANSCVIIKHLNSLFSVRESKEKPHFSFSMNDNGKDIVLSILFRYEGERGFLAS